MAPYFRVTSVRPMQPDHMTPSQQGTGNKRRSKTGNTVPDDAIPEDNRAASGVREGATEDSDVGGTEPSVRHPNRPERDKLGGNFNGPMKQSER
jgi:hypothetical protein